MVMHEESGVGLNPTFSLKAEATAGDDQMDVRMPFHVGAKSVDDNKYAHTRRFLKSLLVFLRSMALFTP
jgi:hypothetical protein